MTRNNNPWIIIILIVGIIGVYIYTQNITNILPRDTTKDLLCINSGGTVRMDLCCGSVGDFPSNCLIGACGCAPINSLTTKICSCPEGKCFDGTGCVNTTQKCNPNAQCADGMIACRPPSPETTGCPSDEYCSKKYEICKTYEFCKQGGESSIADGVCFSGV